MTRDHSLALVYFCALAAVGSLPCLATAQVGTGPLSPMGGVLCGLLGMVYGNFGRALITLAVVSPGVGALLGKVSWGLAIMIAVGVGLIFGAPTIARAFLTSSGSTGVIGCCVTGDGLCGPSRGRSAAPIMPSAVAEAKAEGRARTHQPPSIKPSGTRS